MKVGAMREADDILISVDERHANNMLSGRKRVELRRRRMVLSEGDRVWIYSKVPRGQVDAIGIVDHVFAGTPSEIWGEFSDVTGVAKDEFFAYFSGIEIGYAIVFQDVTPLRGAVRLEDIRQQYESFQPPQFFQRLSACSPILQLFEQAYA